MFELSICTVVILVSLYARHIYKGIKAWEDKYDGPNV